MALEVFFLLLKRKLIATNSNFKRFAEISVWIAESRPSERLEEAALHELRRYFSAWQISFSWRIDTLFALNIMHVDVAFLTLLPISSFNCGNKAKVALCSRASQVFLATSIFGRKLFGYSHGYNAGKDENCFTQVKLILVVKSIKILKSANEQNMTACVLNRLMINKEFVKVDISWNRW